MHARATAAAAERAADGSGQPRIPGMQGDVVLTREQIIQLRPDSGAAAGLRGPAAERRQPGVHPISAKDKLALALLRGEHARLLAAARASVAAAREGASNPWFTSRRSQPVMAACPLRAHRCWRSWPTPAPP